MSLEYHSILDEIASVLNDSDFSKIDLFESNLINSKKIVVFGAGRVGFMMKSFSMRLNHLGKESYFLGDVNVPKIGSEDLVLIGSGSGNTSSVVNIVQVALKHNIDIISITANPKSFVAENSRLSILLNCPNKDTMDKDNLSKQPMTTLFEQSLFVLLDSVVLNLMRRMGQTNELMLERHNILE